MLQAFSFYEFIAAIAQVFCMWIYTFSQYYLFCIMHCAAVLYCSRANPTTWTDSVFDKSNFIITECPISFAVRSLDLLSFSCWQEIESLLSVWSSTLHLSFCTRIFIWIIYFHWIPFHFACFLLGACLQFTATSPTYEIKYFFFSSMISGTEVLSQSVL